MDGACQCTQHGEGNAKKSRPCSYYCVAFPAPCLSKPTLRLVLVAWLFLWVFTRFFLLVLFISQNFLSDDDAEQRKGEAEHEGEGDDQHQAIANELEGMSVDPCQVRAEMTRPCSSKGITISLWNEYEQLV